jgi:hypothetical protein
MGRLPEDGRSYGARIQSHKARLTKIRIRQSLESVNRLEKALRKIKPAKPKDH